MSSVVFEELLHALRRRLAAADHGDSSLLFDEFAADEVAQLARFREDAAPGTPEVSLARFFWLRHLAAKPATALPDLRSAIRLAAGLPPELLRDVPAALRLLGLADPKGDGDLALWYRSATEVVNDQAASPDALTEAMDALNAIHRLAEGELWVTTLLGLVIGQFRRMGDPAQLDAAIALGERVHAELPDDHDQKWIFLGNLALALRSRFMRDGNPTDLDAAIEAGSASTELRPSSAVIRSGLAIAFEFRFGVTADPHDLRSAIENGEAALGLYTEDDPERLITLMRLAAVLLVRAERERSAADCTKAVGYARAATIIADDAHLIEAKNGLADALFWQVSENPDLADVHELEETLRYLRADCASEKYSVWLAETLLVRFKMTEELTHFDNAIEIYRRLAAGAEGATMRRSHGLRLGYLLRQRAQLSGSVADLVDGIMCSVQAVTTKPGTTRPELAALHHPFQEYRRTGDPAGFADPAMRLTVESVMHRREIPQDLEARTLAGWAMWLRAAHFGEPARVELSGVLSGVHSVYLLAPAALPESLVQLLNSEVDDFPEDFAAFAEVERHYEIGLRMLDQFEETGDNERLHAALDHLRQLVDQVTGEDLAAAYNNIALALGHQAELGDESVLPEALDAARRSVELSAADADYLPGRLSMLCAVLTHYGRYTGDRALITEAREAGERGVELTPADHPSRGLHIVNLCTALIEERDKDDIGFLSDVVARFRSALVLLPPGHKHHTMARVLFASALRQLAEAKGEAGPLHEARNVLRSALKHTRGAQRPMTLNALAGSSLELYRNTKDPAALAVAAEAYRDLAATSRSDSPQLISELRNLAGVCSLLYFVTKDDTALDEGIETLRRAQLIPGPADSRLRGSTDLTALLRRKAKNTGDSALLEEAYRISVKALHNTSHDAANLAEHAEILLQLHRMTGRPAALQSSIEAGAEALRLTPAGDPSRIDRGSVVVDGLRSLYELTGDRTALDRGIELTEAEIAQDLVPPPQWRLMLASLLFYNNAHAEAAEILREQLKATAAGTKSHEEAAGALGQILFHQHDMTGVLAFLQEAISLLRAGGSEANQGTRNTLAQALIALFERTGFAEALAEAVAIGEDLVASTPVNFVFRSIYLGNLADYLARQSAVADDPGLMHVSLDLMRAAVIAAGSNIAVRANNLARLTDMLTTLAEQTGDRALVAEAVGVGDQMMRFSEDTHSQRIAHLAYRGRSLLLKAAMFDDRNALSDAREVLRHAAMVPAAATAERITACSLWVRAAIELGEPEDAERAGQLGVELMVELTGPALTWSDRQHAIDAATTLPGEAASAAIAAGHPELAVELLEQSRGVLLAEALHNQIDVTALARYSAELADDFRRVSDELDEIDLPQADIAGDGVTPSWIAQRRLDLGREWRDIRRRVREIPGFEEFLLPPALPAVQEATDNGTVVILNVSSFRCDALLVSGATVHPMRLEKLSLNECVKRVNEYLHVIQDHQAAVEALFQVRNTTGDQWLPDTYQRYHEAKLEVLATRAAVDRNLAETTAWLWETVAGPVAGHLHLAKSAPRRLWWCPTGPLVLLPVHAAATTERDGPSLLDLAVSSYTPTLRALVNAHKSGAGKQPRKMLVVAMSDTPGQAPLPNVAREREYLRGLFRPDGCTILGDHAATLDAVLQALPRHSWVHFSCHGAQFIDAPADSGLLLADGSLTVTGLVAERPRGEFAFLSACHTAASSVTLLNEAITLASALHYAGFRNVIGTLWSVLDKVAGDLAVDTYTTMTTNGRFHPSTAAWALHGAVRRLRAAYPDQPSVWTPFVHIGG